MSFCAAITNIRITFGVLQVVRCFDDDNVIHVNGKVDPVDDSDVINFELALADVAQIERRMERLTRKAKSKEEAAQQEVGWACHHLSCHV